MANNPGTARISLRRRFRFLTPRRLVQLGFVVLILVGVFVVKGNAERWCPFGGVETVYAYFTEGNTLCSVGVANLFILGGLIVTLLLLRRAFCSHACPIGTAGEWIRSGAKRIGIPAVPISPTWDRWLSLLKYAIVALILFVTWRASELLFRTACPAYALLGRHGEDITYWAYVVSGAIVVLSVFLVLPFCRYLCPLAAVMNVFSRFGLSRIVRDTGACIDCGKCARACPMGIPVNDLEEVVEARCTSCLECVGSCPTRGRRTLAWGVTAGGRRPLTQGVLIAVFLLVMGSAVLAALAWPLPGFRWTRGEAPAETAVVELEVHGLSCRGRANLFRYFLDRDDPDQIEGYLYVEAWPTPEPQAARARITYDPSLTNPDALKAAITETYIDYTQAFERPSPFRVEGYDPLGLFGD